MIPILNMASASAGAVGQAVFTASQSWTVPAGVTFISMVCVQRAGASATQIVVSAVTVCRAQNSARIGDGGGDGGLGGAGFDFGGFDFCGGGGGGAGGYSGTGGTGGAATAAGSNGSGGGGGGGHGGVTSTGPGGGGGGVGLLGVGSNGTAGATPNSGGTGGSGGGNGGNGITPAGGFSNPGGTPGQYGGGDGGAGGFAASPMDGTQGGALSYKNNVAVTPGDSVTVTVPTGGAARIMWGGGRSYPSNAADA